MMRKDKKKHDKLKNLLARVKVRSSARRDLAHGMWVDVENDDFEYVESARFPMGPDLFDENRKAYTKKDLERLAQDMRSTIEAFEEFLDPLIEEKENARIEGMEVVFISRKKKTTPSADQIET